MDQVSLLTEIHKEVKATREMVESMGTGRKMKKAATAKPTEPAASTLQPTPMSIIR
jgi:hypothetical protein